MPHCYSAFGLQLRANQAIPGLEPATSHSELSLLSVHLGVAPEESRETSRRGDMLRYASSIVLESGEPTLRIWSTAGGSFLRLEYFDGVKFWLDGEGKAIWAVWPESSSLEHAVTYLLGPVLGILLRLRGLTCLHASAVGAGDCAVAFVGAAGAGKSTTAALLARRGYAVLSDDIVALQESGGCFFVLPAYPYLCLWPDSVNMICPPPASEAGSAESLPALSPNWDKRRLTLRDHGLPFAAEPLPLRAIYLLGERSGDDAAPHLERLTARQALLHLVVDSYAANFLDANMRAREFEALGRLVATVLAFRVRHHQNSTRIEGLGDVIDRSAADLGGGLSSAGFRVA